jgi:hypothetical protein
VFSIIFDFLTFSVRISISVFVCRFVSVSLFVSVSRLGSFFM